MQPDLKDTKEIQETDENDTKYLLFSLAQELYGTPLLDIKEVIKLTPIKGVPYMASYFKGVINLRGQIVSVVDLRLKFQMPITQDSAGKILVVDTRSGPIGVIVDDLVSVEEILEADIERNSPLITKVPSEFFIGVAKLKDRLVNLLDVAGCLSAEDMRVVRQSKESAA